jgi:Protein of unknown function DUF262
MDLLEQIARLIGAESVEELATRLVHELGDQRTASPTDPNGLLIELARREHAMGSDDSGVTPMAALAAVSTIDPRIPVMVAIGKQLGLPTIAPISHEDFVKRLYEDSGLIGREPKQGLPAIILAIVKRCESSVDEDDLELFIEGGQPSLLFYETARAFLEKVGERDDSEEEEEVDEEEEEEDEASDQPVRASVKNFLVQSLVLMVEEKQLDIEPAWQRTDVWSLKKKRELIKSLLLGIPLPSIILHSRAGQMSIIDGKQRLLSIIKFVKNDFKLPRYEVPPSSPLYSCRGVFYDKPTKPSLPSERKREFRMREVPALVFEDVPEARLRGIFHLYNVSGMKLNAAEIRNAVYQAKPIHRALNVLAGEGDGRTDLGIGGLPVQDAFKKSLRSTYPGANRRYQGVDFLARYLGYSRAEPVPSKPFGAPSTSKAIDNYFDYCSQTEDAKAIAEEIVEVFNETPRYFDLSEDRLAFFSRGADGRRKFSKLAATTHMVATRLLLHLIRTGVIDRERAMAASAMIDIEVPPKQQSATIWDYQARVMLRLRDALGEETVAKAGDGWSTFFQKMEFCRLPPEEE